MNILLEEGLPVEYKGIPISPDFRNMIHIDIIFRNPDIPDDAKGFLILRQLYPEIPANIEVAMDGLEWFRHRGRAKGSEGSSAQSNHARGFDFDEDDSRIYSAFYATYGINLVDVDFLHWWEFMALFEGLPPESEIMRAIYYRTVNISDVPKHDRKHAAKMKRLYALKGPDVQPMTAEEAARKSKERLMRQYEIAQRELERKNQEKAAGK